MDIIPLNREKLFPPSHEVQPIRPIEKTLPYGKEKKEPDNDKLVLISEKEMEKGKSKEIGKGENIDLTA